MGFGGRGFSDDVDYLEQVSASPDQLFGDAWWSKDGIAWTKNTSQAELSGNSWSPRAHHAVVVVPAREASTHTFDFGGESREVEIGGREERAYVIGGETNEERLSD